MDLMIIILQLILSLSILVIVHEFGHFFFARLFKTRVEKFYLFFNPWFSIFKFKKGDTEYGLGWLPLGGYVKISGMVDESMDKNQLKEEPKPWEFRTKPAWQRLLIILGGVTVNFITAIIIFWMVLFKWGESYIPLENARHGLVFHPVAHEIGLQDGDQVLRIGEHVPDAINDILRLILLEDASSITVLRDGEEAKINIPPNFDQTVLANRIRAFASFRVPVIVNSVVAASGAEAGGLQVGDSIVKVNHTEILYFDQLSKHLANYSDSLVEIGLYRGGTLHYLPIQVDQHGRIGFHITDPASILGLRQVDFGFFEALPAGISKGTNLLIDYVKQFRLVFSQEGVRQLGGFGTIGSLFSPTWDWERFWYNTAFLSIILAFMNILPIPALDGGHVMFLTYEMITRRKPNEKFMEHAQVIGMILLLGLVIWANGNDIYRWLAY